MDRPDAPSVERPSPPAGLDSSLLLVCVANVCRSPTIAYLLQRRFSELGLDLRWRLDSAGTRAGSGSRMCRAAARTIETEESGRRFVSQHRSRLVTERMVTGSGLILVATAGERTAVARHAPDARARTFTMIEAARLASVAVQRGARPWTSREELPLSALQEVLHQHRGSLDDSDPSKSSWQRLVARARRHDPLDVGDVHTGEVWSHAPVMASLDWASDTFSRAVAQLAARADASPSADSAPTPDVGRDPRSPGRPGPS